MTAGFNIVVLALTPVERWRAAGRFSSGFMTEHWFILTGVAAIILLTALLLIVSYNRTAQRRNVRERLFFNYAEKRGLSKQEHQILLDIAHKAGLKRSESIFTMPRVFNNGAGEMIKESLTKGDAEESKWLRTELAFLREKLGFQRRSSVSIGSPTKLKKTSSRHIPTGKKLYITRRKSPDLAEIESTVVKNVDTELTVKLTTPLESKPGELWRARYYFGASVWEVDTFVISCTGDILVLNHSYNVRFVNRRRFLRVPINKPAFITRFPFSQTLMSSNSSKKDHGTKQGSANESGSWGPPEFISATITELGGPGLLIEAPLEVKAGERVMVIFKLSEEKCQNLNQPPKNLLHSVMTQEKQTTSSKIVIVEDIGEVRRTRAIENGFSIAVELIGLSDSNVSELIRATNAASIKTNDNRQDNPDSVNEDVSEPAAVQGV